MFAFPGGRPQISSNQPQRSSPRPLRFACSPQLIAYPHDITHLPSAQLAASILAKERRIAEIVAGIQKLLQP